LTPYGTEAAQHAVAVILTGKDEIAKAGASLDKLRRGNILANDWRWANLTKFSVNRLPAER